MSRDVMRTLTEARPAELAPDAPIDAGTRAVELARAMAPASSAGSAGLAPASRAEDRRVVPARRRAVPLWGGGLGLVGAAAAAALVIASTGGGAPGGDGGPTAGPGPDATSTRTVLLAAAEKAETAPATGKYWRVKTMYLVPVKVGPKTRPYTVEDARISEDWLARNGTAWSGRRTGGAKPRTPQDEKAWRLDGSPSRWNLGIGDTVDKRPVYVQTKPGTGTLVKMDGSGRLHVPIAGADPSFADLEKLPTDPAALRALAQKRALSDGADRGLHADNERVRQSFAARKLIDLLTTAPVSPAVRAAAFRALAEMPVVKSEGTAVDGLGRKGVAFSIVTPYANSTSGSRLIIDPSSSQVLSVHEINTIKGGQGRGVPAKERTTLYLGGGWTDEAPRPPALP
ncbi:CU044_5270 family protein [Spirillospora sp. CA-255316]